MPSGNQRLGTRRAICERQTSSNFKNRSLRLEMHSYAVIVTGFWKVLYLRLSTQRPQDLALATD
ncbi:Hypothetical protein FKW44_014392 [Caligus rogercresseyi]|uniref:Uncharacterized protein n=1 Tax=Caligus rogercresseyi TaxID=217165 RepID=A0A7T8JZP8_CALRO|nr:Hypothetical protein FKW44_014392 [Caligus rogercresseyi]